MSGSNPFRRSKIINPDESLSSIVHANNDAITSSATAIFNVSSKPQSSSHPKVVRIATPPLPSPPSNSTSAFPAVSFTGLGATQPSRSLPQENDGSSVSSDHSELDPFDPHSSGGVVGEGNASHRHRQPVVGSLESANPTDGSPAGPIHSPPSEWSSYNMVAINETNPLNEKTNNNTTTLDVHAFTRLLMTGTAEATSNTPSTSYQSVSKPGTVSDPITRAQSKTPVEDSSIDKSIGSQSSQQPGAAGPGSMARAYTVPARTESGEIQRISSVRRPKPPPPRSHHGKPIKPRDPTSRTSDRDISDIASTNLQTSGGSLADYRESLSLASRTSSPTLSDSGTTDDAASLHRTLSQSKRPPTPPIARRRSQMRPNNKQNAVERPNRLSLTPKSPKSQFPGPLSPGAGSKTPPRPPSRRYEKNVPVPQPESASSQKKSSLSQGESAPLIQPSMDEQTNIESSSPPSRQPSVRQNSAGSTTMTTMGNMPPPPPPPRRLRASSKSSNGSAQAATVSTDKAEFNGSENTSVPPSSNANDILADLSRLQREVDDLRRSL